MLETINVGDIVFSKSHGKRGKVVKIKPYNKSVLVEVIIKFNKKEGIRTTKLLEFSLSDVELYRFKHTLSRDIEENKDETI